MARPIPYCIIYFISTILTLTAHIPVAEALLSPPGKVWVSKFEPPYDNRTLLIELAVHDWWTSDQNNAVINAGTEFTVLDGAPWRLPNNVNLSFGPASSQEQHHLAIFLTDTGTRLPVPLGLTETATSGCTAASNAANMSVAHCPVTNQEWTLSDPAEEYAIYVMWTARPNGTLAHNGTQPPNFFFGGAELTVTTGSYSASVSWPNMFFQSSGASNDPHNLNANINFAVETFQSSYLDVISTLTTQYFLLLPTSNPMASGFVVPKSIISSVPQQGLPAELVKQWNACRSSNTNCSVSSGFCTQALKGMLPLTSWLGTTAADVVANSWNALNRGINKTCYVVGNGEQLYIHADFTVGASHQAQFINCDYVGTYLVPTISLSTSAILQGAISPPPQSPPPSPTITSQNPPISILTPPPVHLPPSVQGQITSPQAISPTSKPFAGNGIPVSVIITFPDYTETSFNNSGPSDIIAAIQASVIGLTSTPFIRILSITSQPSTVAGGRRLKRSLMSQGAKGIVVDAVITFAPADATPASAFVSLLQSSPSTVFSPHMFGNIVVQRAVVLNCIIPCGPHGNPAPSVVGKAVTCTCDCDAGWTTLVNQPFDSFVYCSSSSSSSAVNDTEQNNGGSSTLAPSEVPVPPPPAPYALQPGGSSSPGGISIGVIVAIVFVLIVGGTTIYIAWRTRCCCFCKVIEAGGLLIDRFQRNNGQMPAMPAVEPILAPGPKTTSNANPTAPTPTIIKVDAQAMSYDNPQGAAPARRAEHELSDKPQTKPNANKGRHGKNKKKRGAAAGATLA